MVFACALAFVSSLLTFSLVAANDALPTSADPCACLYEESGQIPAHIYASAALVPGLDMQILSTHGSYCAAWDMMPGTVWFSSYCNASNPQLNLCAPRSGWCQASWCWVDASCPSAILSTSKEPVLEPFWPKGNYYSYKACGSGDCVNDEDETTTPGVTCPYDPKGDCSHACDCLYQDGFIPESLIDHYGRGYPLVSVYGHSCDTWDMMPGTPWFRNYCNASNTSSDLCSNSWCHAPWCWVNASCPSAIHSTAGGDHYFSYKTCGGVDCWNEHSTTPGISCPIDPAGKCGPTCVANSEKTNEKILAKVDISGPNWKFGAKIKETKK